MITEGKIHSAVESLRKENPEERSYLDNSSFFDGMDKWKTGSKATLYTLGGTLRLGKRPTKDYEAGRPIKNMDQQQGALCLYPEQLL